MKLTILIGCFNEKATILKAIEQAKEINIDKEIIVTDNCSVDGTKEILETLKNDKALKIIFHSKNMGVGYSGSEGIYLAKGNYFYAPGADLEYKMSDVYKMIEKLESENLDAVFGSRLLDKKIISLCRLIKERPHWLGSIISTFLVNLLYGRDFTDVIATKLVKTDILKSLNMKSNGQAFEFELVSRLCKKKLKIKEVPVWYSPRTEKEGKKIKAIDIIPALISIFKIKFFG
jgi:glycosyltransferase involved in cell wall biosynthesis